MFDNFKNKINNLTVNDVVKLAFAVSSIMYSAGYLYRSFKD